MIKPDASTRRDGLAGFYRWIDLMAEYPKRDKFFSHRFVRLLQKSCAAQDIGQNACLLLCYIVHTEDAARYSGPVRFWNEQLMNVMAFKSPKQLTDARSRAEAAGWLNYERSSNRQVGRYWVTVPPQFEGLSDDIIEPNHSVNHSADGMNKEPNHSENGTNSGKKTKRIAERISYESETESGKPSIPNPDPNPNPKDIVAITPRDLFNKWNEIAGPKKLSKATRLGTDRQAKIKTRLNQDGWFIAFLAACDKLPLPGDGWQPDIDWIIANDSNVAKILEGKYDWRATVGGNGSAKPKMTEEERRRNSVPTDEDLRNWRP